MGEATGRFDGLGKKKKISMNFHDFFFFFWEIHGVYARLLGVYIAVKCDINCLEAPLFHCIWGQHV